MNRRQHLLAVGRLVVPTSGLGLICGGVFIKSIPTEQMQVLRDSCTYLFMILGFVLLAFGVLWAVSHGMKKVLFKQSRRRSQDPDIQIYTVDRPNFYPPTYEESQDSIHVLRDTTVTPTSGRRPELAPPMYAKTCSEIFSEDLSLEQPPSYQQALLQSQVGPQASDRSAPCEGRNHLVDY